MAGIAHRKKTVFGLDIGTRSIVGTVGYMEKDRFVVLAQRSKEHETRSMLDGQIHDIRKVGSTIAAVKEELEKEIDGKLNEVCIAAAGRVLRTITTHVELEFPEEKTILEEDIYALSAKGVEKAYEEFLPGNDTDMKFYCVGYSVIRYFMNQYPIGNPEEHTAANIGADMIVTFLPEDVVDGLYKAVEHAGLTVANLTLEPIAAIQVAIPEKFRMLNIALVDVGAGTSDISITKDGAIVAYGMIPIAGDSLTEVIAKHCLVDFNTAEQIKRQVEAGGTINYTDIMGLPQTISAKEVAELLTPAIEAMTTPVAECIRELNGEKSVSAVFVVGGGGRVPGYTQALAEKLDIVKERVAVRGEDVMGFVDFPDYVDKSSLLVTPIGICLSFYEQNNNFIFVTFNEERIKIYDNGSLSVVDVAMQADFPNDGLFPKRGKELNYTMDGKARIKRGEFGEAAVITLNGDVADIHTPVKANDVIAVKPSTAGEPATLEIGSLPEFHQSIMVYCNGKKVELPKFALVNDKLQSAYYEVKEGDAIHMQEFYSVGQILEFMDLTLPAGTGLYVNNMPAHKDTPVYENFSVVWKEGEAVPEDSEMWGIPQEESVQSIPEFAREDSTDTTAEESADYTEDASDTTEDSYASLEDEDTLSQEEGEEAEETSKRPKLARPLHVVVNGNPITLLGKPSYVYVDVFDYIDIDLKNPQGNGIVTNLNGVSAEYLKELHEGDEIEVYWKS